MLFLPYVRASYIRVISLAGPEGLALAARLTCDQEMGSEGMSLEFGVDHNTNVTRNDFH